jgi:hypothetical protein
MTQCVFVVIGAGASYDSTSSVNVGPTAIGPNEGVLRTTTQAHLRPPLVTELFEPRFAGILDKYPIAQWAAADITRQQNSVKIEEFLREQYRDSDDPRDQRKFHAVHWYLQDLLWTVSRHYTSNPDNYYRLMTGALKLPEVAFITLNYDTLLDDRLRLDGPIDSLEDYVHPGRSWALIKLHGSVDWGVPILGPGTPQNLAYNPPARIDVRRNDIRLRRVGNIDQVRVDAEGSEWLYPALSVPVGTRDEFSCPDSHIDHLRKLMAAQEHLDVLMLGYSALDAEVLTLFKDSGKRLRSLYAVNRDEATAVEAYHRVVAELGHPFESRRVGDTWGGPFSDFVTSNGFDRYRERLQGL